MSYAQPQDSGRKAAGFAAVVVFHVALGYALVSFKTEILKVVQAPLETKIIEEVKPPPPDKPPPPPPPKLAAPPPPFIPPPEVRVDVPPPVQQTITAVASTKPPAEAPIPRPAAPAGPSHTSAVVDAKNCAKPEYPPAALRAQETGLVVLQFLIGADNQVLDAKVERSSGFRRLDDAAKRALSLCKFKAGLEDGKPVQSWARIEYLWKLDD